MKTHSPLLLWLLAIAVAAPACARTDADASSARADAGATNVPSATQVAPETYRLSGESVAIYNLAGAVEVVAGTGPDVEVVVTRGGGDASTLRVETGPLEGRETLRVIFPDDDIHYASEGWGGSVDVAVADDGTFRRGGLLRRDIRVSSRGGEIEAYADLRISVPPGKDVRVELAGGTIDGSGVEGTLRLATMSGRIAARNLGGEIDLDTGSGNVSTENVTGALSIDTGSGRVEVASFRGSRLVVDTGSGSIELSGIEADALDLDTGSGSVRGDAVAAGSVRVDTGSGSVALDMIASVDDLEIDTGSGQVEVRVPPGLGATFDLDTGSGGIEVDLPLESVRRSRGELRARSGDGSGRIRIDTGSGGIRVRGAG